MNVLLNAYICTLRKNSVPLVHEENKQYTLGTIANSQNTTTKINRNGTNSKVRILVEQVIHYLALKNMMLFAI